MASEMNIELRQISASASEATMGKHVVPIDRPDAKGGGDAGPLGGELFLAAVAGCFMSNLLAAIKARNADIRDVRVEVDGALADSPARFAGVELRVTAESADGELLEKLVEIAQTRFEGSWKCAFSSAPPSEPRRFGALLARLKYDAIQAPSLHI